MRTLASFSKAEDAHLLRMRLEGSGIAAYVRDENVVSVDWLYSNVIGGVKVDVADEDFVAASEVLRDIAVQNTRKTSVARVFWTAMPFSVDPFSSAGRRGRC